MATSLSIVFSLIFFLFILHVSSESTLPAEEEEFTEELLFRPLPDRKVLSHFHFQIHTPDTTSYGPHHRLFPKAIYQLVHKYRIRELELSFTQGRWNYESWGGFDPVASSNAKPPGVELWAVFDVPADQVDASWKNLTHTLSGLFCASINFLESSTTYAAPDWSFRSVSSNLRYGSLPREAVCTENLTPWLKLLPCRDKAGLSSLMDRPSIYRGFYHSQRLHLTSSEFDPVASGNGIVLEQTLTIVLQPDALDSHSAFSSSRKFQPSWSMNSLFGRTVDGKCALAKSSNVYVQLEGSLVNNMQDTWNNNDGGFGSNQNIEFSVSPDRMMKEVNSFHGEGSSILYGFSIDDYHSSKPFDLGFKWKLPVTWSCVKAPLRASRFLMGSGNEKGAIALSLQSTEWSQSLPKADNNEQRCRLRVDIFQVVPWYIKVYYHTAKIYVDGMLQSVGETVEKLHVSPSEDKVSPGVMEMILRLPCDMKSAFITLEFDKGFLHIDEYPPDANQGFDIPSAIVSYPDFHTRLQYKEDNNSIKSPMVSKMQEKRTILSYTEVLLVPLTTPDFSMPYNVITITCTVFALYFGSLLNALRRRVGEEERLLKDKKTGKLQLLLSKWSAKLRGKPWEPPSSTPQSSPSKLISSKVLFKVVLIAAIGFGWQYYSG
ncbi:GPI transamidase component PIG-T [Artemisia annua]|uniref:GPI transamidase component PIG-T n=1 Tax=Artemisia annua TaxID=35608 RepID=A0A2U1MHP0_ARTAN|nr:GPI transamidase component PIG-T [Artemisia annua]